MIRIAELIAQVNRDTHSRCLLLRPRPLPQNQRSQFEEAAQLLLQPRRRPWLQELAQLLRRRRLRFHPRLRNRNEFLIFFSYS